MTEYAHLVDSIAKRSTRELESKNSLLEGEIEALKSKIDDLNGQVADLVARLAKSEEGQLIAMGWMDRILEIAKITNESERANGFDALALLASGHQEQTT